MFAAINARKSVARSSGLQMSSISVTLTVRFTSSCSCIVEVDLNCSVLDVKKNISEQLKVPVHEIQLILAGKILDEEYILKDLCIGNYTVLHAFQQKKPPSFQLDARKTTEVPNQESTSKHRVDYQYFVFCKECQSLQPGKLRVMCGTCGGGQIVLSRDPDSFDDVLIPERIQGDCKSEQCTGEDRHVKFYYKCAGHQGDDMVAVLQHIRPNRKRRECSTCEDVLSPVLVFPCERHHIMCLECFKAYCVVKLNDRSFIEDPQVGYSVPCPVGCENSLLQDAHHFSLLGKDQYERLKNFATENYVLQNGGILCPAPDCGAGFILEDTPPRKVTCPSCDYIFCRNCLFRFHEDSDCRLGAYEMDGASGTSVDLAYEQARRARLDLESLETIDKISKPCPNCQVKTERSGGCMHMTCSRCQFDWCWLCEHKWNRECQGNHWFG